MTQSMNGNGSVWLWHKTNVKEWRKPEGIEEIIHGRIWTEDHSVPSGLEEVLRKWERQLLDKSGRNMANV